MTKSRGSILLRAAGIGALGGLAGAAAMLVTEKAEQAVTHRPNSYVPARTLLTLIGSKPAESAQPVVWNHVMHWGTAALVGAVRGMWAVTGIRGPIANTLHTGLRLSVDQTLENTTGAGAPQASWPLQELLADLLHKTVYSVTTGAVADRMLAPVLESRKGATSH